MKTVLVTFLDGTQLEVVVDSMSDLDASIQEAGYTFKDVNCWEVIN